MRLNVTRCADAGTWDAIVRASPQGTVFSSSAFQRLFEEIRFQRWLVLDEERPLVAAVVLDGMDGDRLAAPYPFARAELFLTEPALAAAPHRRVKECLEAMQALLGRLESSGTMRWRCHAGIADVRAFQWFHYHEPELGRFAIDVRLTGWIDLQSSGDFDAYLATVRPTRRNEYRQAVRHGLTAEATADVAVLDYLHRLTFERQGLERDPVETAVLMRIAAAAVRDGFGELLLARAPSGEPVSAALFLHDHMAGHYVAGANHPDHRKLFGGTFCFLESVRACMGRGLQRVDVCGINSPNRGDFKTSFNAAPTPYFEACWVRPPVAGAAS